MKSKIFWRGGAIGLESVQSLKCIRIIELFIVFTPHLLMIVLIAVTLFGFCLDVVRF